MVFNAALTFLRARWWWVCGRCPRCSRKLDAAFAHYMTADPNCPVCRGETQKDLRVWRAYRASVHAPLVMTLAWLAVLAATPVLLQAQDAETQKARAIAAVKKLGGTVEVDTKSPDRPVVRVDLKHTRVDDASLEHFRALSKLETLHLQNTDVTDNGLVYLKGLTNIEALELARTKVTDQGVKHLAGFPKLRHLDLSGTEVTDKGLEHLKALLSLEALNLGDAGGVSDAGLVHLRGMMKLRKLNLAGTKVTEAGVRELRKKLPMAAVSR